MKTLYLIRHAKSSWDLPVDDKYRSLKERGVKDSILVANGIKSDFEKETTVFSSPAHRAIQTAILFLDHLDIPTSNIQIKEELYTFSVEGLSQFVKKIDNSLNNVTIFSHNYALTEFVNIFGDQYCENLPTAGVVKINFDITDWKDIEKGKTVFIDRPKNYKS